MISIKFSRLRFVEHTLTFLQRACEQENDVYEIKEKQKAILSLFMVRPLLHKLLFRNNFNM